MNDYTRILPQILEQYPVHIREHEHLRTSENLVVKLRTEDDTLYALRIRRIVGAYDKQVASELQFLHDFQVQTGVQVPAPVRTKDGELFCRECLDGEDYLCILFSWVPGIHINAADVTSQHMERMAVSVAQLHNFSRGYKPDITFMRPVYDEDLFFGKLSWSSNPDFLRRISAEDAEHLLQANEQIRSFLNQYPKNASTFGMIHYDLHVGNFLFTENFANMIDFDECGFGYYLFDLAHILFEYVEDERYEDFGRCAVGCYEKERPDVRLFRHDLNMFVALQGIAYINWMNRLLTRDGNAEAMEYWIPVIRRRLCKIMVC